MRELNIPSIRSIDRAIDILDSFSIEQPALSAEEISKSSGIPKSTVYRILYTLERRNLVRFDEGSNQYKPGIKLMQLGLLSSSLLDVRQEAEQPLTDLQIKTNQTVLMAVGTDSQIVYILKKESSNGLKYASFVGEHRPYLYGVLGPVLLASLSEKQIHSILDQGIQVYTENSITDKELIIKRLDKIRDEGYFIESGETNIGVTGVGAPVFNAEGEVIAAIGVVGPSIQFFGDHVKKAKELILHASKRISIRMGYSKK